jgi:hypothetical protein
MELLEAASLLLGFGSHSLEPADELKGIWVNVADGFP